MPAEPKRATVYDVATRAGVSIATVSYTFRRPDKVRAQTRAAVLAAARELGYAPSAAARGLVSRRTGALGLHSFDLKLEAPQEDAASDPAPDIDLSRSMIPWDAVLDSTLSNPRAFPLYVDEVQRGFELEARRLGRTVLLSSGAGTTEDVADTAGRVDALAVFPSEIALQALSPVSQTIPVVLFSVARREGEDAYHRVLVDNAGGMRALVSHLVEEHGITDLGFVGPAAAADFAERFSAMRGALQAHAVPARSRPVDGSDLAAPDALARVRELAATGRLPRALVCANDQLALAVMDVLRSEDVRIPEDAVVTGFDGILAGMLSAPGLTTVRQPMEAMGRVAARLLTEASTHPIAPREYRLGTGLIVRRSCGCTP